MFSTGSKWREEEDRWIESDGKWDVSTSQLVLQSYTHHPLSEILNKAEHTSVSHHCPNGLWDSLFSQIEISADRSSPPNLDCPFPYLT